MRLKVADIVFDVVSDRPIESLRLENSYRSFFCHENPDIILRGHYSALPSISLRDEDKVFNSNIFWDVYRVERQPVFVLRTNLSDQLPYCIAVFQDDYRSGDIYYRISHYEEARVRSLPHPLAFPNFHLLMISLLSKGYGVLIHACGINNNGHGLLFTGSSTHGKTTMARLWEDKAVVLNDERIVLRQNNGRYWIYGTPWHGEYEKVSPQGVPLEKIFFLRKAEENTAVRLKGVAAASYLLRHCFLPYWDTDGMNFIVDFCANVTAEKPCYELGFVPERSVVDFVRCVK